MTTLPEFLLERIAEDEAGAREALAPENMHPWGNEALPTISPDQVPDEVRAYLGGAWGEHFARHDPARVLADCATKRQLVERHQPRGHNIQGQRVCGACHAALEPWPCTDIRLLAQPYADDPGFDPPWRL